MNDWKSLSELFRQIEGTLHGEHLFGDVVIVDDGSSKYPDQLAGRFTAITDISILRLRRNVGHQRAITIGLAYCSKHKSYEPNSAMVDILRANFKHCTNVEIVNQSIRDLLDNSDTLQRVDCVFLFHVVHHLPIETVQIIPKLLFNNKTKLIIIEPNHLNPLYFVQILITNNMKYDEEKGMFRDNSNTIINSLEKARFKICRKYIGFLPRGISNIVAAKCPVFSNSIALSTRCKNPFSSYSVLEISSK